MRRILLGGLLVSVIAGVFGCAGNTTNNPNGYNIQRSQLLGLWRDTNVEAGGLETACPGTLSLTNGMIVSCGGTIEFRSDMTFTQKVDTFGGTQVVREGRWTIARNLLSLYYDDVPSDQALSQFTLILGEDGNSIETTHVDNGITIRILIVRQVQ